MDERSAEIIQRAFDAIDRVTDAEQTWADEAAERDPHAPDAAVEWERLRRLSAPSPRRVHKMRQQQQPQPQQQSPVMDAKTKAAWDSWCDARIRAYVEGVVEILGDEVGRQHKKLYDEINALRTEVALLSARNITSLRGRDVA